MSGINDFCGKCGSALEGATFPKTCGACSNVTYGNPTPVAVMLLPVYDAVNNRTGILLIHRGHGAFENGKALPGGYVDHAETAELAAIRELKEETGITLTCPARVISTGVAKNNNLLIFCLADEAMSIEDVAARFTPTSEATAFDIAFAPETLCFPLHTAALKKWFDNQPPQNTRSPRKDFRP